MMATIIESPDILQRMVKIPKSALDICKEQGIPTAGNCAGNRVNVLDTTGCNSSPPNEDWG
jgi:iron transport multicopper oxidase